MIDNPFYTPEFHGEYDVIGIGALDLEEGGRIPDCRLAVATFGELNEARDNAIMNVAMQWVQRDVSGADQSLQGRTIASIRGVSLDGVDSHTISTTMLSPWTIAPLGFAEQCGPAGQVRPRPHPASSQWRERLEVATSRRPTGSPQVCRAVSAVQANYAVIQPSWCRRRQMRSAIKALCRCRDHGRHR